MGGRVRGIGSEVEGRERKGGEGVRQHEARIRR